MNSRLVSSGLVSSKRSLVARAAMMVVFGTMASCQSATLQSSNIANETCNGQPCAVPISDNNAIANGEFLFNESKIDGIRTAVLDFAPRATIKVDSAGTPAGCSLPQPGQIPDEACVVIDYAGGVSVDTNFVNLGIGNPSNVPANIFNLSTPSLVDGGIEGTAFETLGRLSGRAAYDIAFELRSGNEAMTLAAPNGTDPNGVYFVGDGTFPTDNAFGEFLCDCITDSGDLPDDACKELCDELETDSRTTACTGVNIQIKLNKFKMWLGFIPKLPSTQKGDWTRLFGGKNFHLPEMFDTEFVVKANAVGKATTYGGVGTNTQDDIVVGARLFGCTSLTCTFTNQCDAKVSTGLASNLSLRLQTQIGDEFTSRLGPLFNYDGSNLPGACSRTPDPILPTCTTERLTDWAAASFTYQKWSWLAGAFGSYPNDGWLPIRNITDVNFPLSNNILFQFDNDIDGDGILTPDDRCPTIKDDEDLFDQDGDGIGDLCDRCPNDATNDGDRDGVCEDLDTCPGVWDPLQSNCNERSEEAHNATRLGDACDPVPCAAQKEQSEFVIQSQTICPKSCKRGGCPPGCPTEPYEGTVTIKCGSTVSNQIDVYPLASHPLPTLSISPKAVLDVPTHARFCYEQPGITCNNETIDIQDERLDDTGCAPPAACAVPESDLTRFHRLSFFNNELNSTDPNASTKAYTYDVNAKELFVPPPRFSAEWNYQSDYLRWKSAGLFAQDPGSAQRLEGNFWLHSQTLAGDVQDVGTGLHGAPGQPPQQNDELANSHNLGIDKQGFRPQGDTFCTMFSIILLPSDTTPIVGPNGQNSSSVTYADEFASYLVWRPLQQPPTNAFRRVDAERDEADYVFAVNGSLFGVPSGGAQGEAQVVNDRLGAVLKARLANPNLVWVNAAEPYSFQGTPDAFPTAVALARIGGEEVIDTVHTDGRFLLANQDRAVDPPDPRDGSPHAIDYTAVLTRMHRGIFVLGGRDVQTNQETHEIWFNPLSSTHWNVVPSDIKVEKVLAATYDFQTDELVVLDETPNGLARLWALKMRTYDTRILGTWPRHAAWNRHWLVVDRDGSILLASSNVTAKRHALAHLGIQRQGNVEMEVKGIESGNRAFVLPPLVDANGYTYLLRQAPGNGKVKRERYAALPLQAASASDVGGQL